MLRCNMLYIGQRFISVLSLLTPIIAHILLVNLMVKHCSAVLNCYVFVKRVSISKQQSYKKRWLQMPAKDYKYLSETQILDFYVLYDPGRKVLTLF
jgi:hypothetical protein